MKSFATRTVVVVLLALSQMGWCGTAMAYRPFVGTDAAVADPGEVEVELGPAEYLRVGSDKSLTAPEAVFNYGFAQNWEAVLQGMVEHGLSSGTRGVEVVENEALLKSVLREGSLQDKPGPSIATEFGLLLPGINAEPGTGGSIAGIVSQQWPWLTVHFNLMGSVTRQQHGDLFISTIVEGPHEWTVRPVSEIFYEQDFGAARTISGLIGAIWQARDNLAVDFGLRQARINDRTSSEIRAGLTFSFYVR